MKTNGSLPGSAPVPDSQDGFSCDMPVPRDGAGCRAVGAGRVFKYLGGGQWEGVPTDPYKDDPGDWDRIVRRVIVGHSEDPTAFHLRYFEISKGGFSSLEHHEHVHVVIGVRGHGEVRIRDDVRRVGPFDVVYVGPHEPHQLKNLNEEPFGFFCIVDAKRDRPVPLGE